MYIFLKLNEIICHIIIIIINNIIIIIIIIVMMMMMMQPSHWFRFCL